MFDKKFLIVVLVAVAVIFGVLFFGGEERSGGTVEWQTKTFVQGFQIGSNGTVLNKYRCDTATWNPGSVSSSTAPDTLDVSNDGADLGDVALSSFDSSTSTSQWETNAKVTSSGTTTISIKGVSGAAVDLSTSTAKVCTIQ